MANSGSKESESKKLCFVTLGATADFLELLEAVCNIEFVQTLQKYGYTELRVQYGKGGSRIFSDFKSKDMPLSGDKASKHISLTGFDFKNTLSEDMRLAKGGIHGHQEGVIISHAGTGSILEAFRVNAPLVLVPNTSLLDNHQQELAEELSRQKYAVIGSTSDLRPALDQIERERKERVSYLAVNHRPDGKKFTAILDEEMGFLD